MGCGRHRAKHVMATRNSATIFAFYLPAMGPIEGTGVRVFETGNRKEVAGATKPYGEALNQRLGFSRVAYSLLDASPSLGRPAVA
jgi:hypothetical protein